MALKKFFENVLQAFLKHIDFNVVRCAVIASPGSQISGTKPCNFIFVSDCLASMIILVFLRQQLMEREVWSIQLFTQYVLIWFIIICYFFDLFQEQFHRHLLLEAERRHLRPIIENKSRIILVHTSSGYKHSLRGVGCSKCHEHDKRHQSSPRVFYSPFPEFYQVRILLDHWSQWTICLSHLFVQTGIQMRIYCFLSFESYMTIALLLLAATYGLLIVATKNGGPVDIHRVLDKGLLVDPHDQQFIDDTLLKLVADRFFMMDIFL
ncbi:hypothetical protein CRYUN_Cryun15aG0053400 [Craigia yunnanensis]